MTELKPDRGMPWCPAYLLEPGETAIWWGRPNLVRYMLRQNMWLVPIILVGLSVPIGAAITWLLGNTSGWLLVGGTVFSLVVGFLFWGSFLGGAAKCRNEAMNITYLLTDRRALIEKPSGIVSIAHSTMKFIESEVGTSVTGNVLFHEYWVDGGDGRILVRDGFIGIADAEAVAREMRRLQAATP